mmetsp:Transcript_32021/g.88201  ORF Transcript_32021/g.88201 Transcript_32021/m.88201 type:complete len:316 (+) Transcript_32021:159-1106(+)
MMQCCTQNTSPAARSRSRSPAQRGLLPGAHPRWRVAAWCRLSPRHPLHWHPCPQPRSGRRPCGPRGRRRRAPQPRRRPRERRGLQGRWRPPRASAGSPPAVCSGRFACTRTTGSRSSGRRTRREPPAGPAAMMARRCRPRGGRHCPPRPPPRPPPRRPRPRPGGAGRRGARPRRPCRRAARRVRPRPSGGLHHMEGLRQLGGFSQCQAVQSLLPGTVLVRGGPRRVGRRRSAPGAPAGSAGAAAPGRSRRTAGSGARRTLGTFGRCPSGSTGPTGSRTPGHPRTRPPRSSAPPARPFGRPPWPLRPRPRRCAPAR